MDTPLATLSHRSTRVTVVPTYLVKHYLPSCFYANQWQVPLDFEGGLTPFSLTTLIMSPKQFECFNDDPALFVHLCNENIQNGFGKSKYTLFFTRKYSQNTEAEKPRNLKNMSMTKNIFLQFLGKSKNALLYLCNIDTFSYIYDLPSPTLARNKY